MIYTLDQQYEIFNYYFGQVSLNTSYKNPLRSDKTPKCYFIEKNNKLIFIDWAFLPTHLNCIEFVKHLYNIGEFNESINKINFDLKYSNKTKGNFLTKVKGELTKAPLILLDKPTIKEDKIEYSCIIKEFDDYDLTYWQQYNIDLNILNKFEIKSVKYVLRNNVINYSSSKYNPIFAYYNNNTLFKIYNPLGSSFQKWRTIQAILEGYSKLEYKTNVCFITSSLKDTMCLSSLGFDVFNLPSENSYKTLLPVINNLFNNFEAVYVYTDNDRAGVEYSRLLTLEIDNRLKYHNNPSYLSNAKDPSDLIVNHGKDLLIDLIHKRFEKDNILFKIK